jgi:hypothetical protein
LKLQIIGPSYRYFPEPKKSVLIMPFHNLGTARSAFADLKFLVVMGSCHLGGFIGQKSAFITWIQEKNKQWTEVVPKLAMVAQNSASCMLRLVEISAARVTVCTESQRGC